MSKCLLQQNYLQAKNRVLPFPSLLPALLPCFPLLSFFLLCIVCFAIYLEQQGHARYSKASSFALITPGKHHSSLSACDSREPRVVPLEPALEPPAVPGSTPELVTPHSLLWHWKESCVCRLRFIWPGLDAYVRMRGTVPQHCLLLSVGCRGARGDLRRWKTSQYNV